MRGLFLKVAGVSTWMVKGISFVGGRICSFITEKVYKMDLVKAFTFEGSHIKVSGNFDPMPRDNIKRNISSVQAPSMS